MSANAIGWTAVVAVLLIVAGFALVWAPLGLVVAGFALLAFALLSATTNRADKDGET